MTRQAIAASMILIVSGCSPEWTTYGPGTADATLQPQPRATSFFFNQNAFEQGFDALKLGDYDRAQPLFAQHLTDYPEDPYALLAMGTVMENEGRPADAMTYYRAAAKYGTTAPLGETLAVEGQARTVNDLAQRNMLRLVAL